MAKTRAQRKAEKRAREQQAEQQRAQESKAAERTQVPESPQIEEAELAIESGTDLEELGAPAPSRADTPPAAKEPKAKKEKKPKRKDAAPAQRRPPAREERKRGRVIGFLASSWAELRRVQWPDREHLTQASAVTVIFVAIAAAYLGVLDLAINWAVKQLL